MKQVVAIFCMVLCAESSRAELFKLVGDRPTLVGTIGSDPRGSSYPAANAIYSNIGSDQFTGFVTPQGVTVSGNTNCYADDVTFSNSLHPVSPGASITSMSWSAYNANATATVARMKIRFWLPDGANGGPGTYVTGVAFPATSIPTGVSIYSATIAPGLFLVPPGLKWWAGLQFDNTGSGGTTNAQLANLGQGLFGGASSGLPEVGYSDPQLYFKGVGGNVGGVSNPVGTLPGFGFPNGPTANFGWEFVPEPATLVLVALGALALLRR